MNWFESLKYIINNIGKPIEPPPVVMPSKKEKDQKLRLDLNLNSGVSWSGIVWHHSKGPDGHANDWEGIRRYHTNFRVDYRIVTKEEFKRARRENPNAVFQKPWSDIGYHGGVELIDGKYVYQEGRPLTRYGAHSAVVGVSNEFNKTHIGLCAVGDFDGVAPSKEMWQFCLAVTRTFMDTYGIDSDRVIGHREVFDILGVPRQKSCPGDLWDMEKFRNDL